MEQTLTEQLLDYLDHSRSCYHAADRLWKLLEAAGYELLAESQPWKLKAGGKYAVMRGDSALAAFRIPGGSPCGFLMAAGHSDSPTLKIRETAEVPSAGGTLRLSVEPYGGGISRSWLDRPLSAAGRVMVRERGRIVRRLVDLDRDLAIIPSVAIHMDRAVNQGTALKANTDMLPLLGMGKEPGAFRRLVAECAGVAEEDLLSTELFLYPRVRGTVLGMQGEFLASPRLDDLQCVFACARGFLDAAESGSVPLLCVFNNEEVGSNTRQGADSTFLRDVTSRISRGLGLDLQILLANSFLVSADNAHAVHPAHPEYADPQEQPLLNGGIVLKYNANQRYTTDALSAAVFTEICREAGVPVQRYSNRADLPGGSTLGNISSAHLSVPSVDIGLPQLAMHSCFEVAGTRDAEALVRAMRTYFSKTLRVEPDGGISLSI